MGLTALALAGFAGAAQAQTSDIFVGDLGAATPIDPGVLNINNGGFSTDLWAGTPANWAVDLIERAPEYSESRTVNLLVQRTLLSEGEPPAGGLGNADYAATRISKIWDAGYGPAARSILARTDVTAHTPLLRLKSEMALAEGRPGEACDLLPGVMKDRDAPYWRKLRTFCLFREGRVPAAELSVDRLRRSGHDDRAFYDTFALLTGLVTNVEDVISVDSPLTIAMAEAANAGVSVDLSRVPRSFALGVARNADVPTDVRLTALARAGASADARTLREILLAAKPEVISDQTLDGGIDVATPDPFDLLEPADAPDYNAILAAPSYDNLGHLYELADYPPNPAMGVKAVQVLMMFGADHDLSMVFSDLLQPLAENLPPELRNVEDARLFAAMAMRAGDMVDLDRLYYSLSGASVLKQDMELAVAAMRGASLDVPDGFDLELGLQSEGVDADKAWWLVNMQIATGAALDAQTRQIILSAETNPPAPNLRKAEILALQQAAATGSKAETALLLAEILDTTSPSSLGGQDLAVCVGAMRQLGLYDLAGRLIAENLLEGP